MHFERLRQLLIQKAIEGKLVPQLAEEPAVEQIGEAPEEVPFEIPEKWKWIQFKYTCNSLDGKRIPLKKDARAKLAKLYPYYGATGVIDFVDDFIFDGIFLLIGEDGANLLSRSKDNAFVVSGKIWVNNHAHVFNENGRADLEYLSFVINGMSLQPYVTGSAQPKLTQKNLYSIPVPLPSLTEQRRIVARLNELFSVIKEAEAAYKDLQVLGENLRAKMIQKAIEGKLVPQLEEEPAVEQIGEAPEAVPFEIPGKWKWCSLSKVSKIIAGQSPLGSSLGSVPTGPEFHQGKTFFGTKYIKESGVYTDSPLKMAHKGSILLSVRAPVGAVNLTDRDICIGRGLFSIIPNDCLAEDFLFFALQTKESELQSKSTGTTFKAVTGKVVRELLIPIPPLAEQRRIVAKLNELLPLVDKMVA